jgi:tetratricopeptide (TPR) repeat protein
VIARGQPEPWLEGMVDHFRAIHAYNTGQWVLACTLADSAAEKCWACGNLRLWSAVVGCAVFYSLSRGDSRWIADVEKFWSVVRETNDRQARVWAMTHMALIEEHHGEHERALATLYRAAEIYSAIPDPRLLAHTWGMCCMNLLKLGRVEEALEASDRAMSLTKRHHLSGNWSTCPFLAAAEASLRALECARPDQRPAARERAVHAVSAMSVQGRRVRDHGAVDSRRVAGTLAWLDGRKVRAHAQWSRGLAEAEALGAKLAAARLLSERGSRSADQGDIKRAIELFKACQALGELRALQGTGGAE